LIIEKVEIENIRSYERCEIDLSKGITTLTGRTGAGKSTILMAIEYALFGSEGLNNSAILRRGTKLGKISLTFKEGNDTYNIIRTLKRQGKTITAEPSGSAIFKNNEVIPLLGRANDLNQKILEVLKYPSNVKAKELFETTSYTRQDEIRKLIEMSIEKRQEQIDKILMLSKYKDTWENLKDVINDFQNELLEKKTRLESESLIQKDIELLKQKIKDNAEKLSKEEREHNQNLQAYQTLSSQIKEIEEKIETLTKKRRVVDELKGQIIHLRTEIEEIKNSKESLEKESQILSQKIKIPKNKENLEEFKKKKMMLENEIEIFKQEKKKIINDFSKIKNLGEGKCPVCLQNVTLNHINSLKKEFEEREKLIDEKIHQNQEIIEKLLPQIKELSEAVEIEDKLQKINELIKEKEKNLQDQRRKISEAQEKIKVLNFDEELLNTEEKKLKKFKTEETELLSKINAQKRIIDLLTKENKAMTNELAEKTEILLKMEKSKEEIKKLERVITLLNRLREDIRNIREIIRRNFLEEFRQEFQRKFEEIRKYEEEYTVDINLNYEPIAYTKDREEVPISNLSGGEKTSVALSYRLALSNLAAQISAIKPPEVLILDEPTIGLDKEDIKALNEALQNIGTIPQIIIVTHEDELKDAANFKYEVKKERGLSKITKVD